MVRLNGAKEAMDTLIDNLTIRDVLRSKTIKSAAETAKTLGINPYIINDCKSYYYTTEFEIYSGSLLALPIGDTLIEIKAVTKAGIKQLHNIIKQFNIKTLHYKSLNKEHLLFFTDNRLYDMPYDQLIVRSLNDQHGLFINIKNSYTIIPPSSGYKLIHDHEIDYIPNGFVDYLLVLHDNVVVQGKINA